MYDSVDKIDGIIGALSSQQKILSNNIANAHTPGYVRQQYKFSDVLGNLENPFETKLSSKMGSMMHASMAQEEGGEPVNLANEMIEMQKVFLNYTMVTRRVSTIFNNIRRASQIGR